MSAHDNDYASATDDDSQFEEEHISEQVDPEVSVRRKSEAGRIEAQLARAIEKLRADLRTEILASLESRPTPPTPPTAALQPSDPSPPAAACQPSGPPPPGSPSRPVSPASEGSDRDPADDPPLLRAVSALRLADPIAIVQGHASSDKLPDDFDGSLPDIFFDTELAAECTGFHRPPHTPRYPTIFQLPPTDPFASKFSGSQLHEYRTWQCIRSYLFAFFAFYHSLASELLPQLSDDLVAYFQRGSDFFELVLSLVSQRVGYLTTLVTDKPAAALLARRAEATVFGSAASIQARTLQSQLGSGIQNQLAYQYTKQFAQQLASSTVSGDTPRGNRGARDPKERKAAKEKAGREKAARDKAKADAAAKTAQDLKGKGKDG